MSGKRRLRRCHSWTASFTGVSDYPEVLSPALLQILFRKQRMMYMKLFVHQNVSIVIVNGNQLIEHGA
jgi:hypothetical protein